MEKRSHVVPSSHGGFFAVDEPLLTHARVRGPKAACARMEE
jgi:hypothetical protein